VFNIFFRKKISVKSDNSEAEVDEDIPRYPPFAKGLPAAPTAKLIKSQEELIGRIRGALRFNKPEFEDIVLPVIERYAAYVHLLPASEAHHHRGAGGLFRHGLEVGFWSAQRAESHQFCVGDTPQNRRENEPRWQFACFLGGLLHDVGKPLSDVAVTDKTGSKEWNPYESSLAGWTKRESVNHYFLRWRDKRGKRHEKFSIMNLDQIITPTAKSYLNQPGPNIMEALLESIVGTSASDTVAQIVLWADGESVRRDLVNQRLDIDEYSYGVPVERYIFDALRQLVSVTKINEPGALIWRLDKGVYLAWNQIVPEIRHIIEKDNIPGVPRNADTLADILIERGFAVPFQETTESKPVRYWRIYPEVLKGVPLNCLRLDDLELIFTNEPPPPVKASFTVPNEQNQLSNPQNNDSENNIPGAEKKIISNQDQDQDQAPLQSVDDVNSWKQMEGCSMQGPPDDYYEAQLSDQPNRQMSPKTKKTRNDENSKPKVSRMAELAARVDSQATLSIPATMEKQKKDKPFSTFKGASEKMGNEGGESPGWDLIHLALNRHSEKQPVLDSLPGGSYGIPHPESASVIGEPRDVMNTLSEEGLLRAEKASTSKTTLIKGKKYLVLNRETSRFVKEQLEISQQVTDQNKKKRKPASPAIKKQTKTAKSKPSSREMRTSENRSLKDKATSKLPSQEDFGFALTEQITQGFGPYIAGDVASKRDDNDTTVYKASIASLGLIASELGTTPIAIQTMVRKVPSVQIIVDHDKGDYIELKEDESI